MAIQTKQKKKTQRRARVRARISGTADRPRLSVFRSNRHTTAQLINDISGETLTHATSKGMKGTPVEQARKVGEVLAKEAKKKKIGSAVFDRSGFPYRGRIKAVAEGAREAGLTI